MNEGAQILIVSLALLLGNAFFVAAEYGLLSARRSRMEAEARKGHRSAGLMVRALDDLSPYVAGVQIAITMCGIGLGALTEPYVTGAITRAIGTALPSGLRVLLSILIVTFVLVVVGEIVPKYLTLQRPDRIALITIRPLRLFVWLLTPMVRLVQASGALLLRPFGIDMREQHAEGLSKDEIALLVQAGGAEGVLDKMHAEMVGRALRLDTLTARDIMVHRLDVKWLDADLDRTQVLRHLRRIPYSRIPVCRGDIDDVVGVIYLHNLVLHLDDGNFNLERIVRAAVFIPENLSLERIVDRMRDERSQILIVMDEYGGTSGLITLEDVIEEIFGELEDRLEVERPLVELGPGGRVTARGEVRYDELLVRLGFDAEGPGQTKTLAQLVVDSLERVPRTGDSIEMPIGVIRVENMARRRITRVSIQLSDPPESSGEDS
jgi:putative hemolysin